MDVRVVLFLLVLGTSWCCNARVVTTNFSPVQNGNTSALQLINQEQQEKKVEAVEEFGAIEQLCTLCVNIATPVLSFLQNSNNQEQITSVLNKICSLTLGLKDKCSTAVNYYLPLFYTTVDVTMPELFCVQIGLCNPFSSTSQPLSKNSCESCYDLVTGVLLKLKDPDTQLDTIEVLLKACSVVEGFEGFAKKCKTLVSVYTPTIFGNAEQFLKKYDMCTMLHSCNSATNATLQTSMHSIS